ncbi:MAG: hypothetical protein AAF658_13345, partial [Myxococcota bacterium]
MIAALTATLLFAPACEARSAVELVLDDSMSPTQQQEILGQLRVSPGLASLELCRKREPSSLRRAILFEFAEGRTYRVHIASGEKVIASRFLSLSDTAESALALTVAIAIDEMVRASAFPIPERPLAEPKRPVAILAPVTFNREA